MNKSHWAIKLILSLAITLSSLSICDAIEMGITTGREKGTYYQFGLNLRGMLKDHGINLNVYTSNGSVENIYSVYKKPGIQIGIVQSDVLAFIARVQSNRALKSIAKKIKMVFPLYNEEVHVVGRKGITDFEELADKRVAIGEEGSGSYLTAKLLFEVSEIAPQEVLSIGTDEALARLKDGTIDAMFYVAGYPVKLFAENVTEDDNLDLIPITNKTILEFYPRAEIPGNTYKWRKEALSTVAVKAVLVSYDFKTYFCENVGKFARQVSDHMNWLVEHGHPKWKSVDINYQLKGWQQYDCVKRYLGKTTRSPKRDGSETNPIMDAIKDLL